jgi:hypothetical protein
MLREGGGEGGGVTKLKIYKSEKTNFDFLRLEPDESTLKGKLDPSKMHCIL